MRTDKTGKILIAIWGGCAMACSWISILFDNAGKISFAFAVIGVIVLAISCIYEIVAGRKRLKGRDLNK